MEELKNRIISELEFVVNMSPKEYILYDKWREFNIKFDNGAYQENVSKFFEETNSHPTLSLYKNNIWVPKEPMDYLNLKPTMILVDNPNSEESEHFKWMIKFISSFNTQGSVGRSLKYIVKDDISGKYLGVINIASDIAAMKIRDDKIGWTNDNKYKDGKLNNTAQGHAFLPAQPFGHNYVGGKLLALFGISKIVEDDWYKTFGDKLVGLTTTSLYGRPSQYSRLKYWKEFGDVQSSTEFHVSKDTMTEIRKYLKMYYPDIYKKYTGDGARRAKSNMTSFIYKLFDIDKSKYISGHLRGIYFCPLYENIYEFLRNEIKEKQLKNHINNSIEYLIETWKEYATKRINKLIETDNVSYEVQFYDDLMSMTWEETKEKYLK